MQNNTRRITDATREGMHAITELTQMLSLYESHIQHLQFMLENACVGLEIHTPNGAQGVVDARFRDADGTIDFERLAASSRISLKMTQLPE